MTNPFSSADLDAITGAIRAFTPERLTLAREAAGLEVRELAEQVQTTPSAISQLEHGKTRPKAETLLRLSLALSVPPGFFAAGPVPDMPAERCHFRRRRGAPKREQKYVLARGRIVREVVGFLEDAIDFPEEGITGLQRRPRDRAGVEALAATVRDAWDLGTGPIGDTVALLELHGVIPVEVRGHSKQLDAFSIWASGRPMVFLSTDKDCASRRRWDAAHELGHLLMHASCEVGDAALEREADWFASAFLLPADPFRAVCPSRLSWPALRDVKRRWGTSLLAIVRRAYDLGIYSEATYRRAHVQYAQSGWRAAGEPDEPPMEHPALVTRAMEMLDAPDAPPGASGAALRARFGTRLLEETVRPRGRAA